jgi:hypothetical protein
MSNEDIIEKIKKKLENHEKRITQLEKPPARKEKSTSTKRATILDMLDELKAGGFFDQPKLLADIANKLAEEGYHYPQSSLTKPLQRAIRGKMLGRLKKNGKWAYTKR